MDSPFYLELWVELASSLEDLWSGYCFDNDATGIETITEDTTSITLRVFFEHENVEQVKKLPANFCAQFSQSLDNVKLVRAEICPYTDWQSSWKEHFQPIEVCKQITVCPPWAKEKISPNRIPLVIDPGQGFGTGYHTTTVLAMELLEQHISQINPTFSSMVDIGTGSGILSIEAGLLGIPVIHAVDIDVEAVKNAKMNIKLNKQENIIQTIVSDSTCLNTHYDVVISNMLLHELLEVKKQLVALTHPSGVLICSGFLTRQWKEFRTAMNELGKFEFQLVQKEEWGAVLMRPYDTC